MDAFNVYTISFYAKPLSIAVAKLINNTGNAKIIE